MGSNREIKRIGIEHKYFEDKILDTKINKFIFLGLAFLHFLLLALELVILLIESIFYGTMDFWTLDVHAIIIHWICTISIWSAGLFILNVLSKKIGYNIFENNDKPKMINLVIVGIIIIITAAGSYISWEMRFKPFVEFTNFINKYNGMGIVVFIFQYLYYITESILFFAIVVFAQEFGERTFKSQIIPWGGIICGLTWGLGHLLTQNSFTGIYLFFVSIFYGVVYLQVKKNVKYAYIITAIMFII
jgi:hypothetical protein